MHVSRIRRNNRAQKGGRRNIEKVLDRCDCLLDFIFALFLLPLCLVSLVALYEVREVEKSGKEAGILARTRGDVGIGRMFDDYKEMIAWLTIPGTNIDYPVMQATNNSWYLSRDYKDDYSPAGSLFVDYRNNAFKDDYSVIYGHRMSGEMMFGEIAKFKDDGFLREHKNGELLTRDGLARLSFWAYAEVNVAAREIYAVGDYMNGRNEKIIKRLEKESRMMSAVADGGGRQLLILSTCDKTRKNYRDVLVAWVDWQ